MKNILLHPLFDAACWLLWLFGLAAAFTGCESIHSTAPVDGAAVELRSDPTQVLPSTVFAQGKNAHTPSTYKHVREGVDAQGNKFTERTDIKMGTVRDPVITVPPPPPWGEWIVAGIGALALIGGGVLLYNGWPKVGGALAAGGGIAMVIALTVDSMGWLYAIAVLAVAGFAAWTLYSGYKSGLKQPPATITEPEHAA